MGCHFLDLGCGTDVEADDDGLGGRGQQDVGLGDGACAAMDHVDRDLVGTGLLQGSLHGFKRALHVCLDHQVERFLLVVACACQEGLKGNLGLAGQLLLALGNCPGVGNAAGHFFVLNGRKFLACHRHAGEALHFHRNGRTGFLDLFALVVQQGTHAA